jgi:hypothetical protein
MRRFPSPPNPLSHKERGGTCRIRKRPISFRTWVLSAPERKQDRGDSGAHVWHSMAVDGHREQLFCPPLNAKA